MIARTERPKLPTLDPELVRTERLNPLMAAPIGKPLLIDAAQLDELYTRLAEYGAAVERANKRAGGVKERDRCVAALFATGKPAPGCPALPAP
ncbi:MULTISPECIES: hypothetical protein [Sphingomonas]|uniref:hypothetical protein n=1 Tax=Sphingomonas TaxID=13687 RepID=UPI00082F6CB4|nr:hypothetical protein [Sphingomonas sp. CCH10-B3]